jgi:hypothetical protein
MTWTTWRILRLTLLTLAPIVLGCIVFLFFVGYLLGY